MKQLLLEDLLHILDKDYKTTIKVKYNQYNGIDNPIDLYKENPDKINKQWLFWRNKKRYFNIGDIVICLAEISKVSDTWLLTTIKKVTKELNKYYDVNYEGEVLKEYEQFFGRTIIKYHKSHQCQTRFYLEVCNDLTICEILPNIYDGEEFPGYDRVCLTYRQLKTIMNKSSWVGALENQKAVYLITDTKEGKLYVGSATAKEGMLLQRWKDYINNGHGGNKGLIKLVKKEGFEYIKKHFQYSILENYNAKVSDEIIKNREKWWKKIFKSVEHGYNESYLF